MWWGAPREHCIHKNSTAVESRFSWAHVWPGRILSKLQVCSNSPQINRLILNNMTMPLVAFVLFSTQKVGHDSASNLTLVDELIGCAYCLEGSTQKSNQAPSSAFLHCEGNCQISIDNRVIRLAATTFKTRMATRSRCFLYQNRVWLDLYFVTLLPVE